MNNANECARNLKALLRKGRKRREPEFPGAGDPVAVLLMSFFLWESTTAAALRAYQRYQKVFVDPNDLRVSLPHELGEWLGMKDARALERCQRLRASLNQIFKRERRVSLDSLREALKRDVRDYLDTLEGMVPYVSARVALLSFDTHAIPVDEQLRAALIARGAADESADVFELAQWLAYHIKASEARAAHFLLQRLSDDSVKSRTARRVARRMKKA